MRSGIILAGGNGSRFGGEKALHPFRGMPLIQHVYGRLSKVCYEVVVVVRSGIDARRYSDLFGCRVVADLEPGAGPLMGMYTGLLSVRGEESVVVGADMPFLSPKLVDFLFSQMGEWDAVVPKLEDTKLEPLLSVYRAKPAAAACKRSLDAGKKRMVSALDYLRVRYIPAAELKVYDPVLESLTNVNSRKDLDVIDSEKSKD